MTVREIYEGAEELFVGGKITLEEFEETVDIDLDVLDTNIWTPCKKRLPNKSGEYLITTKSGKVSVDHYYANDTNIFGKTWGKNIEPLAWREFPESYTA